MNMGGQAQTTVFRDTWKWSDEQTEALDFIASQDSLLREAVDTLIDYVTVVMGEKAGLRAYLAYMAARLLACRIALKASGSIYLHCDPTAGHYLKLLMDATFGYKNRLNEIVWQYKYGGRSKRWFGRKHDLIYFYVKNENLYVFNEKDVRIPFEPKSVKDNFNKIDADGRRYREGTWKSGKKYRYYEDEGRTCDDVWLINSVHPNDKKRRKYDTQKPISLLERIIKASSNEGDLILDPFCGCGTAVETAQILNRKWIGIDVEPLAVDVMANRLRDECGVDPKISGIPYNFDQAQRLARTAPFEFERWALRLVPGAEPNFSQVGDRGLDGRSYIDLRDEQGKQPRFGFQVKGGANVGRPDLDAFAGALQKNKCIAGLFIVLREATAKRLRGSLATQDQVQIGEWASGHIGVWSVENWFSQGERCLAPVPPLVGASETLGLLKARDWQPRLNLPQR